RFSEDNKMTAIRLCARGCDSVKEISNLTGISFSHLYLVFRRFRRTGSVKKLNPLPAGRPRLLVNQDVQFLLRLARYRPTLFLDEYCKLLTQKRTISVSLSTLHCTFERAGLSVKRVQKMAIERSPQKRAAFIYRMGQYSAAQLFCLDETSKDDRVYARLWGRSK
ncbi:hypothetical protein C8J56DRAFT_722140, partial [Mycena floridula]